MVTLPPRADRLGVVLAFPGTLAAGLLLIGLVFKRTGPLPWAYAFAGASYAGLLFINGGKIDGAAPLYAAALLLSAELAYWSLEQPVHGSSHRRRAGLVALACLVGGAVAGLVLSASEFAVHGGLALEVLGVAAAVGVLALVARLARADPQR